MYVVLRIVNTARHMSEQSQSVHFLGDGPHKEYQPKLEVLECIRWLEDQRFSSNADLDYCPSRRIAFEVLCPLKDCRDNGENLSVGRWQRSSMVEVPIDGSSIYATFTEETTGRSLTVCVGYYAFGNHRIMAWKDNIRLVSPT